MSEGRRVPGLPEAAWGDRPGWEQLPEAVGLLPPGRQIPGWGRWGGHLAGLDVQEGLGK